MEKVEIDQPVRIELRGHSAYGRVADFTAEHIWVWIKTPRTYFGYTWKKVKRARKNVSPCTLQDMWDWEESF